MQQVQVFNRQPTTQSPPADSPGALSLSNGESSATTLDGQRKKRSQSDDRRTSLDSSRTKTRDGPKKKKAARACFHCQKAHLTCDDARPCQRCVKRGIADNCTEGHRKKAKYLLEDDELDALKNGKTPPSAPPMDVQLATAEPFLPGDPLFNLPFDPTLSFGSEAANLEYSILSAILGNPTNDPNHSRTSTPPSTHTDFGQRFAAPTWPAEPLSDGRTMAPTPPGSMATITPSPQSAQFVTSSLYDDSSRMNVDPQRSSSTDYPTAYPSPAVPFAQQQMQESYSQSFSQQQSAPSAPGIAHSTSQHSRSLVSPPISHASPMSTQSLADPISGTWANQNPIINTWHTSAPNNVYDSVTKAYDYIEGYHFLMKFLKNRFEANDLLRVVRALAIFRPSLIALQAPLSEEDEIFVEKCFQRSLIELDKLISFTGTPTVVWRRTGEICLVGLEFCQLTEWDKEDLINNKKYIYELFENQSVVEYWEKFALHAFENTTQSVYSHCVLLKQSGEPVPCAFCFSIRRDIFDLPSAVIGQWLPLL